MEVLEAPVAATSVREPVPESGDEDEGVGRPQYAQGGAWRPSYSCRAPMAEADDSVRLEASVKRRAGCIMVACINERRSRNVVKGGNPAKQRRESDNEK